MTAQTDERPDSDWQLPLDLINASHKERIAGHEDFVPFMLDAWWTGMDHSAWTVWIGGGTDRVSPRDAMLHAAKVMCSVGCDYLVLGYDTHSTELRNNPSTGKPWGPGEMQRLCDEQGFCETGQLRDTLIVMVVRRTDQKIHMHQIPYHFHKGEVMFYPEHDLSEWSDNDTKGVLRGRIPDVLREAMAQPTITEIMSTAGVGPELMGFDMADAAQANEVRLHQILAGVRILAMTAMNEELPNLYMNVIPATTDQEKEIIEHSAERSGILHSEVLDLRDVDQVSP